MRIFSLMFSTSARLPQERARRAEWWSAGRVLAAGLALLVILVCGVARSQEATTVTPQQLMNWCQGLEGASSDQMITGCTVMIEAGQSSERNKSIAYTNRGEAHRSKGDYDQAINDFDAALDVDPANDMAYANRGVTRFIQADFQAAADDLVRAIKLKDDAYSMLWHFLARERGGAGGGIELAANAARLKSSDWPASVIAFYLGQRSASDMLSAAGTSDDRCEAQFYLGEWHLLRGNRAEASNALRAAAEACPPRFYEYVGAVTELKRLDP